MLLKDLLSRLDYYITEGNSSKILGPDKINICAVVNNSQSICAGCLYMCIKGSSFDGHDMAYEAAMEGASAILVEHAVQLPQSCKTPIVHVTDSRIAMANISAAWFGHPAEHITTIGVTGTKGKTTTTYLIKSILENSGYKVGLIGTIETVIGDKHIPSQNTTPESYLLQMYMQEMIDIGCNCVVMEVSSQALKLHRCDGFTFDIGVFTNLEPDHIGPKEHETFEEYLFCKSLLFQHCRLGILNIDDSHFEEILTNHTCEVQTFGLNSKADFCAYDISMFSEPGKLGIAFKTKGKENLTLELPTPGMFSVYNALAATAVAHQFNCPSNNIKEALKYTTVNGRFEVISVDNRYNIIIDYAHNAMALQNVLKTLKEYKPKRLICIFGCGGNRSKLRRYEMGEVSGKLADISIITTDNPRFEDPLEIIKDIEESISKTGGKYISIPDRRKAIAYAMENSQEGDVILICGKGHEPYEEIKGIRYHYNDKEEVNSILKGNHKADI